MHAPEVPHRQADDGRSVFGSILVGIDETTESLVGAAQAGVLREPSGRLVLLAVAERYLAAHAGMAAPHAEDAMRAGALADLEQAKELVDADEAILASGRLVEVLRRECARSSASLLVVGVRPHRRLAALTFGGHEVEALHDAPCSVLVARPGWGPAKPHRVVVGVDGSPSSVAAEDVARSLGARLGCEVLPVVALEGNVPAALLRAEREDALLDPGGNVDAVVGASSKESLIVVARGQDRRTARDVDRIVHGARCSVLVLDA